MSMTLPRLPNIDVIPDPPDSWNRRLESHQTSLFYTRLDDIAKVSSVYVAWITLEPYRGDTDLSLVHVLDIVRLVNKHLYNLNKNHHAGTHLLGQSQRVHVSSHASSTGVLSKKRRVFVERSIVLGWLVREHLGRLFERV